MSKLKEEKGNKSRKLKPGEVIHLGMAVRDTITDIVGIAFYRLRFLQGCDHIGIAPLGALEDGKMKEIHQTDVLNLEVLVNQANALPPPNPAQQTIFVGDWVQDPITGRMGTVTICSLNLFEANSVHVQPKGTTNEGKPLHSFFMEDRRAKLLTPGDRHNKILPFSEYVTPEGEIEPPVKGGPALIRPAQRR